MEFGGTERYQVESRIGAGAFGVVYAVHDRERGDRVALKTLRHLTPSSLYRFKQEFRSLAGLVHPNLISLYELESDEVTWFFTMELVDGADFLSYLRGGSASADGYASTIDEAELAAAAAQMTEAPVVPAAPVRDERRLRAAFRQLAEGVQALHQAGKLHRDLKPSNILVGRDGRVVVLDFGLVKELTPGASIDDQVLGSVAYMAPEQALGGAVAEAADWYSVGVMLYEALAGTLPFAGSRLQVLIDKQSRRPGPPASAPPDLAELCAQLLDPDPASRPSGDEVLRRLGWSRVEGTGVELAARAPLFVGRERELELLHEAFAESQRGSSVAVRVDGPSGMGKSLLVQRFLDQLRRDTHAVVLSGRCFERESMPYKALDSLVDALCRYLVSLEPARVDALLPRDVGALARIFPVLERVELIRRARERSASGEPQETRRRGFAALRELVARLAQRVPLVLVIDDLQWGDTDSARLLLDLLRPPDPPPLLLLAAHRGEAESPFLRALAEAGERLGASERRLTIGPLPRAQAAELVRRLLRRPELGPLAEAIADEAEGNPFFLVELADYLLESGRVEEGTLGSTIRLEDVLLDRVRRLPPRSRRLLEVVAIAGGPIPEAAAAAAAYLGGGAGRALFTDLRARRLLRSAATVRTGLAECYHDRVRQALLATLDPETARELHYRIALGLERLGGADPEVLAAHFEGAGLGTQAARHAELAAARALDALAFDRATTLLEKALSLGQPLGDERRELLARLAAALALAGEARRAALSYLEAAQGIEGEERALEWLRCASEQYLLCGMIDEGLAVMGRVAPALGLSLPSAQRQAFLAIPFWRLRLRLRGLDYVERSADELPAASLRRLDAALAMGRGMGNVDPVRTAVFHAQSVLLALDLGEPTRVLDCLNGEVMLSACGGLPSRPRTLALIGRMRAISERLEPRSDERELRLLRGRIAAALGFTLEFSGNHRGGLAHLDEAAELLATCAGRAWNVANAQLYALDALARLGELAELSRRVELQLRVAAERGNRLVRASTTTWAGVMSWLAADRPDELSTRLDEIMAHWSRESVHIQHLWATSARVQLELYRGEGSRAAAELETRWRGLYRLPLTKVQLLRLDALDLRGRVHLAAGTDPGVVEACARQLEREGAPSAVAKAALLRAGAAGRKDPDRALRLLEQAELGFAACELRLQHQLTRLRRGELIGGEQGRGLVAEAGGYLTGQGVVSSARMAGFVAPGRW